jgi:2-methylcitrate dehydratase PrpD
MSSVDPSPAVSPPLATQLAGWAAATTFEDLPDDVVEATKRRILDVIGLALTGGDTPFGRSTRAAALALSPSGPCRVLGTGEWTGPTGAAFVNGALAQALEFDDTHNESIVHMSSPAVAAALALSETKPITGRELLAAIAIGNEISCRAGSVSPGQFHRRGLHPTGLFAPFGVTYAAGKLLGLEEDTLASAAGICGSLAAGILECWVDGTQTKFLHSGWAAQSGIAAAHLAAAGITGPPRVFEGRFGFFASHLQDPAVPTDFERLVGRLGTHWESRYASFKPYPAAHVLHPYVDALLRVRREHAIAPSEVARIECPVAAFNVGLVCEPVEEKLAPATDAHCRISLQHTLAEALYFGELGRTAYEDRRRNDPEVRALACRVGYYVDPDFPGPGRFKGAVHVTLKDGRVLSDTQEHTRGSVENPMTDAELRAKFDDNAGALLSATARDRLADAVQGTEQLADASALVALSVRGRE